MLTDLLRLTMVIIKLNKLQRIPEIYYVTALKITHPKIALCTVTLFVCV